jgi:sulfur relay (sulfurtransferase) DsrC/TusE family protein
LSDKNNFESYIQPNYSTLKTLNKDKQEEFSKELLVFLEKYPQFASSKSHLQCLYYCFDYYTNYDPASRDLPLQKKIERAGEMAMNFLGIVTGPKA